MATSIFTFANEYKTGHAAMLCGDEYLSFHPKAKPGLALLTNIGYTSHCVLKGADGSDFLERETIEGLDEKAIRTFISAVKSEQPYYHFETYNCSTVCMKALLLGAHQWTWLDDLTFGLTSKLEHLRSAEASEIARAHSGRPLETAADSISAFVENCSAAFIRIAASRSPLARIPAVALGSLAELKSKVVWSPGDVILLARQIKKANVKIG